MSDIGTILLVGAGRMGQAMLAGWCKDAALKKAVAVIEPGADQATTIANAFGVKAFASLASANLSALPKPVVLVLAVKPQILEKVLAEYAVQKDQFAAVVSIAAGKNIALYEKAFGAAMPIYRTMPNLPAVVGMSYTFIAENNAAAALKKQSGAEYAETLFAPLGVTQSGHGNEPRINAVTAVTGSGPAYLFAFMEAWIKAAEAQGFPRDEAEAMVRQTTRGALELLLQSNQSEIELMRQVASPGGTTEAALGVFAQGHQLEGLLNEAVTAAVTRAKELE